ncbi:DUF72 domain-containing protein [Arcticibacter tournemirensis]|uniref:DUF72 domain-containing protein n=1 Tax=Arcticibacter tournemirensis TaxID=699437 RepID=A0A4Q0MFV9_9SPHI|nr:DUF72 domain-containing protein [Arcticibacter tournemirensis]RXF72195.1 DUF72 domain-containing protein [Arcticibacter tournemirensis]
MPQVIGDFYSGTSNITLPVRNKQAFPVEFRDKSRLTFYASLFNSLEVNSSFYKIPQPVTVEKWAASVPENFRFTFKLWREITHNKSLTFSPDAVRRFMDTINRAGDKKGCLLVQFPPGQAFDLFGLDRLLAEIRSADEDNSWKIFLEFRNRSWYVEDIYELLDQYSMGFVIHDLPASATPLNDVAGDFMYLRFHGPNGGYRGSYTDDFLYEHALYINEWMQDGKTIFSYFNNTMGDAVKNLQTLNRFVYELMDGNVSDD